MPAIISIFVRLIAQAGVTVFITGMSFLGYEISTTVPRPIDTQKTNVAPITVTVSEDPVTILPLPLEKKIETPGTSTQPTPPSLPKAPPKEQKVVPPPAPSLSQLPTPSLSLTKIDKVVSFVGEEGVIENSVVNLLCIRQKGNAITVSTGSGVIIGSNGLIITNSHVAEPMLIPGQKCILRQGTIASDVYTVRPIFISEKWLSKNAGVIFSNNAKGTGENDVALLVIDEIIPGTNARILPASFSIQPLKAKDTGMKLVVAGYPAGTLGALSLRKYLTFKKEVSSLHDVFTFSGETVDIIETEETIVAQKGSSGGGVFDSNNNLVGIIVSTHETAQGSRVNALTISYANKVVEKELGKSLTELITADKQDLLSEWKEKESRLTAYVEPYL